jgi:hypothetical protein
VSDAYFVKSLGGLAPVDDATHESLAAYGNGEIIRAKLYKDRNPRHHRLFFGLLGLVFRNQDVYLSQEALRFAIMVAAGYVDEVRIGKEKVAMKPKSLSFGSMGQREFEDFYQAALLAIPRLLPQFEGVDLERELTISGAAA